MKVLVTGSQGMLGADIVQALHPSFIVAGVGRKARRDSAVPFYFVDLADKVAVQQLVSQIQPDVILHAAAMTQVDLCEEKQEQAFRDNVEASSNLADVATKTKALLIYISTDYVFNGRKKGEYVEEDSADPLNVYGETKWLGEEAIRRHAERYMIFRTSWVFGLNGKSFPRTILEKARETNRFKIVSDQVGRPSYTVDLADAFKNLLMRDQSFLNSVQNATYHLANEGYCSWADFGREVVRKARFTDAQVEDVTTDFYKRPARRPQNSVLSLEKTKRVLGISMRPWQSALDDFIGHWKKESNISGS